MMCLAAFVVAVLFVAISVGATNVDADGTSSEYPAQCPGPELKPIQNICFRTLSGKWYVTHVMVVGMDNVTPALKCLTMTFSCMQSASGPHEQKRAELAFNWVDMKTNRNVASSTILVQDERIPSMFTSIGKNSHSTHYIAYADRSYMIWVDCFNIESDRGDTSGYVMTVATKAPQIDDSLKTKISESLKSAGLPDFLADPKAEVDQINCPAHGYTPN